MRFDLTIATVIYNEIQYLSRFVQNLKNEVAPLNLQVEWLFVLNHSQKETKNEILKILSQELTEFSYYENTTNNLGLARNLLLQKSQSPLVYFTDPDILHKSRSLSKLYSLCHLDLEKKHIIGYTGPVIHQSNNPKLHKTFSYFHTISKKMPLSFQIQNHMFLNSVDHAPTCHVLVKRADALEIGGFSSTLSIVGEDLDFSHRAYGLQKRFIFLPEAQVIHEQNFSLLPWLKKVFLFGRAQIAIHRLNWHLPLRIYRLLPCLFVLIFLMCLWLQPVGVVCVISLLILSHQLLGFSGLTFLLTLLIYSAGEICELLMPKIKIKNVTQPEPITASPAELNWNTKIDFF